MSRRCRWQDSGSKVDDVSSSVEGEVVDCTEAKLAGEPERRRQDSSVRLSGSMLTVGGRRPSIESAGAKTS